jgi:ferric-dicitrate binding protein FerR (iron transport regulator)
MMMDRRDITDPSPEHSGDLVEQLVRIADRGPEVPAEGLAAVKAAIRPEWERLVRTRRRRRRAAWTAGLSAAAAAVIAVAAVITDRGTSTPSRPVAVASITRVVGSATLRAADGSTVELGPRSAGLAMEAGAVLRTGPDARLAIGLGAGHGVRIDQATELRLQDAAALDLVSGGIYVDSGRRTSPGLEVRTARGTITDIGTRFEVRSGRALVLRVRDGAVHLRHDSGGIDVGAGFEARLTPGGELLTGVIAPSDPAWTWTQEVAPPFSIEGQSAAVFLEWVGHETGLRVRFADQRAQHKAGTAVLHGSVDGLRPAEAAVLILPSCGLRARIEGSFLVVDLPE